MIYGEATLKKSASLDARKNHNVNLKFDGYPPKLGKHKTEYEDAIIELEIKFNYENDQQKQPIVREYDQTAGKITPV